MPTNDNATGEKTREELIDEIVGLAQEIKMSKERKKQYREQIEQNMKKIEVVEHKIEMIKVEKEVENALSE